MSSKYEMTTENKGTVDAALDFPRLKMEKKGEKMRIAIFGIGDDGSGKRGRITPIPEGGYFFDLRVPGSDDREYIGSYECLASEDIKAADEYAKEECPHCAAVLDGNISEEVMRKRKRKFVMPVVVYQTTPGTSEIVTPPSVSVVAWRFTDRYFNVLVDENEKWADSGGLLGHDITLTCEVVNYQTFNISVEPEAAYMADPAGLGKLVLESYVAQTAVLTAGLGRVLGNKLNAVDLEGKIKSTVEAAAQLGIGGLTEVPPVDPALAASIATDIAADLLGEIPVAATEPVVPVVPVVAAEAVPTEAVAVPAAAAGDGVDFDEFFGTGDDPATAE